MKTKFALIGRISITALAVAVFGPVGLATWLFNPFASPLWASTMNNPNAQPLSDLVTQGGNVTAPLAKEIKWEQEVIQAAVQSAPFADNMSGVLGTGRVKEFKNSTDGVLGNLLVINTLEAAGAPGVYGSDYILSNEEFMVEGAFTLQWDYWTHALAIKNTAKSQSILGNRWETISQKLLSDRWAKKMSDDDMMALVYGATSNNTLYPNGKTLDTLASSDTFSWGFGVAIGSKLKDIGAMPASVLKAQANGVDVNSYIEFGPDAVVRTGKDDSAYLLAQRQADERGDTNRLFSGGYSKIDAHVLYPWQNIIHGARGSVGSALQPEALLGTAIVAKGTSTSMPSGVDGGGSAAAAAATPAVNFFEFFSLYAYKMTSGITATITPTATRYFAIKNSTDGLISLFSFTGNSGHQLTGLKRLGSTATGDYVTTLTGSSITWNTAPWTSAADGYGYAGLSEGLIPAGSSIYEVNALGQPFGKVFGLGARSLVAGFGRIALEGGGFKSRAQRIKYTSLDFVDFAAGIRVAYGSTPFLRADGKAPNYCLAPCARLIDGFPQI